MFERSMPYMLFSIFSAFAGFGMLAYISLFDPDGAYLFQVTIEFIHKLFTPFS